MFCICGKQSKGYAAKMFDGVPCYDLWVCANCDRPARPVFAWKTGMFTPTNSTALLSVSGKRNGLNELTWAMPDGTRMVTLAYTPYPKKADTMNEHSSLLQDTWTLLDTKVNIILREPNGAGDNALEAADRERARFEARGVAETLHILMSQFYPTSDAVVKEAVARFKANQTGAPHDTPGLAESIWDPNTRWDGTAFDTKTAPPRKAAQVKPSTPPKVHTGKLLPEQIKGVKDAVSSGMFAEADVAEMFKVSVEEVRAAVAS